MELSAPFFIFVLLPLTLLICRFVPKGRRRLFLSLFSLIAFVAANRDNHWGLLHVELLLVFILLYAYLPVPHSPAGGKARTIVGVVVPSLSLLLARLLDEYGNGTYVYPIGFAFITFGVISFAVDLARGDTVCPENPLEVIGYLLFFPTLIAGPFIRSKHYFDSTEAPAPDMAMMSRGIHLYMRGFIKRVALAAVLLRSFEEMMDFASNAISPLLFLLLLYFSFAIFYFFITGSADMARGVCAMYGIPTPRDRSHLLSTSSPDRFFYGITLSLHNFLIDYIYRPLRRIVPGKIGRFAAKTAVFAITALLFRTRPEMLLFALPVLVFVLLNIFIKRLHLSFIPRLLLLPLSALLCSFYTLALMLDRPLKLFTLLSRAFQSGAIYEVQHLFEIVRDAAYLIIALLIFLLLFSVTNLDRWFARKAGHRLNAAARIISALLLFIGFVATLFFFYPQFPQ